MALHQLIIATTFLFCFCFTAKAQENFKDSLEIYYAKGEYRKAKMFSEKQVDKTRLIGENGKLLYAEAVGDFAAITQAFGEWNAADSLYKIAAAVQLEKLGPASIVYSVTLMNLGNLQNFIGNYTDAEKNEIAAFEIYTKHGAEDDTLLAFLNNMGLLYKNLNSFGQAGYYYNRAIALSKKLNRQTGQGYNILLNNMGELNYLTGNYNAAEDYMLTSLQLMRNEPQPNLADMATLLSNIASFYTNIENYDAALPLINEALTISKNTTGDSTTSYAITINNRGNILMGQKKYRAADSAFRLSESILKTTVSAGSLYYIRSLTNVASATARMGNFGEANMLLEKAIGICRSAGDSASPQYAFAVSQLAREYYFQNNYTKAKPLFALSNSILKNLYGPGHPEQVGSTVQLCELYLAMNNYRNAAPLIDSVLSAEKKLLLNRLEFLSETELLPYLHQRQSSFALPFSFLQMQHNGGIIKAAYNSVLFLKGVAVQNTNSLATLMQQSKDSIEQKLWATYISSKALMNKVLSQPVAERALNADSLFAITNSREKLLLRRSAAFRGMNEKLSVTWQGVKSRLLPGETAVEFVKSVQPDKQGRDTEKAYYAALLLRPQDTIPIFIKLFEEGQLQAALKGFPWKAGMEENVSKNVNSPSTKANIYNLLWQPLEPYLKQTQTIYFAPDGLLHQIAFAAMADEKDRLLCDKYDLVQLTSTRQIALKNNVEPAPVTFALFGGINYNNQQTDTSTTTIADPYSYAYRQHRGTGIDSFTYLPNTAREISAIKKYMGVQNKQVFLFSGINATEAAFRKLGDSASPGILHFATHGFALPNPIKQKGPGIGNTFSISNNPLLRCGLAMAGGNRGWKGKAGLGEDDGILTGLEISAVPLVNTQLTVLSACETAKGQLVGSEGVFGLQRAFKLAGVNYVMATLWQVPDKETAEFMNYFYQHLSGGISIRQSFAATQQAMRKKYDPYKWAAFTLVQ